MNVQVLEERYNLCCEKNTDMGFHMPALAQAAGETEGKTVVELGTRYGASTIAFLYGLRESGGCLWSVDCSFPVTDPETGIELLNSQGALGCVDYWVFLLGYDTNEMVLNALPEEIDLLFIDTNHVFEETIIELSLYLPRMTSGGRIMLHDTSLEETGNAVTPQPPFPVRSAVEGFCVTHEFERSYVDESFGMGTIYLP